MDKYKQQEEVNHDLMRQIELLEEQGDTAGFAEEMKRIYADRDSLGLGAKVNNNLSQSDKLLQAKNLLSLSASKYSKSRRSNALNKISEEIGEEEENLSISDKKIKKQKD